MSKNEIKNIEKARANFAYDCVEKVVNEHGKDSKKSNEYKSYVKKIPTMIQANGLSATFAFMYSKKKTYLAIYKQVQKWLEKLEKEKKSKNIDKKLKKWLDENKSEEKDKLFIKWLISLDSSKYKHITSEVMALFMWLRRFAEGMIEKEKGNENGKEKEE